MSFLFLKLTFCSVAKKINEKYIYFLNKSSCGLGDLGSKYVATFQVFYVFCSFRRNSQSSNITFIGITGLQTS
jgi:hypothetical protein